MILVKMISWDNSLPKRSLLLQKLSLTGKFTYYYHFKLSKTKNLTKNDTLALKLPAPISLVSSATSTFTSTAASAL